MPDTSPLVALVAAIGALAAGATALSAPRLAFAILFLLAAMSRATLETPIGTMRLEMPAIAVVAVVLVAGGRLSALRDLPRSTIATVVAFATFLGVLTISSAFVAPGTNQSLHMVAWFATSMTGGAVAFVLMRPRPIDSIEPLAFGGAVMGAVGIIAAVLFLIAGPGFDLGIQEPVVNPRVYGLGWETNLYASFLGMCSFFALEATRGPRRVAGVLGLALVLIGFALGLTRGAYIGLAVGAFAYVAVRLAIERRPADLPRLGAISVALLVVGFGAAAVLLPNALQRESGGILGLQTPGSSTPPPGSVSASGQPQVTGSAGPTATGSGAAAASPTPTPEPSPTVKPYPDTLAFRLERVPIALNDLPSSPLIGFGAESFGQRHPERFAGSGQDHIAIMAVVVPYEAGILGTAALAAGFAFLLLSLWQAGRRAGLDADRRSVGAAAAFIGALVSVLVAYQVTNALQLAVNWIVIGAAAALAAREPSLGSSPVDGSAKRP